MYPFFKLHKRNILKIDWKLKHFNSNGRRGKIERQVKHGVTKSVFDIHSIDLIKTDCEKCGKEMDTSIFSSALGHWSWAYVCGECIVSTGLVTKEEFESKLGIKTDSMRPINYMDSSWVEDEDKRDVLDTFLKIEEEDKKYVSRIELWKAHIFKEELEKNMPTLTEKEMFDYFNFYSNNKDIVLKLRELMAKNPRNNYIKKMYIRARTRKLTEKEIKSLKRSKSFAFTEANLQEFWELLPEVLEAIREGHLETDENDNIKEIIESVINEGYYTVKQEWRIKEFLENQTKGKLNNG